MEDDDQMLPIHVCCSSYVYGDEDTSFLQYLPFHSAASTGAWRAIDLLLVHDPPAASKKTRGRLKQLRYTFACKDLNNPLLAVQSIFDAYPEATLERDVQGKTPYDIAQL